MSNLFTCPDCNKEVSKTVKFCPHCGNKKIQNQIANEAWKNMDPKIKKNIIIFLIGFFVVLAIFVLYNESDDSWKKPYDGQMLESGGIMYKFHKNGKLEIWEQGDEYYDISCRCDGSWEMDDDVIVITNLIRNGYCPWMSEYIGNRLKIYERNSLDDKYGISNESNFK